MRTIICTLMFVLLATVHPAFAGDGSITIAPAVMQFRASAGQSTTQTLTITNGASLPAAFEMVAYDVLTIDGVRRLIPAGEIAGSIAATAVFSRRMVEVAPDTSESVEATITIPEAARHRAVALIFQGIAVATRNSLQVVASIGTLATFNLNDEVDIVLEPLSVQAQTAVNNLRVTQWCMNRGTEPVVTQGVAAVTDPHGAIVRKLRMDAQRLLPGERLELSGELAAELPAGHYKVIVTYDIDGRKAITASGETVVQ